MTELLQLPEETRRQLYNQVSIRTGLKANAIEKDWWVTLILKAIFSLPIAEHFIFKGGTSLSKGWKLIERFSEDIDIALAPEAFGRDYKITPSNSYVKTLKREGCAFTSTVIKSELESRLIALGVPPDMLKIEAEQVKPTIPDKDPQTLFIYYPSLFDANNYIPDNVRVEFGVRSLKEPYATVNIQSILGEESQSPAYNENSFVVKAVEPRKTFMEKMILLHEKFQSPMNRDEVGERQSRHLADLHQLMKKGISDQVIADTVLYDQLLEHRRHYVNMRNTDYSKMLLANLNFLPPLLLLEHFRRDYNIMLQEMIYGNPPDFDQLIEELRILNKKLAGIGHSKAIDEVIEQAVDQVRPIDAADGSFLSTTVTYSVDPYTKIGPDNINISFNVEFLKTKSGFKVHSIRACGY